MNKKETYLGEIKQNIIYNVTNHLISNFPIWQVRKLFFRMRGMKIGKGSYILRGTVVVSPRNITIGDRTYINENCFLDGRCGIQIGNDVTVAIYSKIITGGHYIDDEEFAFCGDKVVIGDNAVVFAGTMVLAGAKIESGAVIGAGSVVPRGEYKQKTVYAGNPIKYIKERKSECNYRQDYWKPKLR